MPRFLRYLRIAFSATCVIACVLLIGLWARSYWWLDQVVVYRTGAQTTIQSYRGVIGFEDVRYRFNSNGIKARIYSSVISPETDSYPVTFGISRRRGYYEFHFPYWLIVMLLSFLTVAPWIRQLKCRFSLRTLLIATTLVAVVLGAICYAVR